MRKKIIAGNWKMFKTPSEASALARETVSGLGRETAASREVVLCPPAVDLPAVAEALRGSAVSLGAQNCHPEAEGAYTGEVSLPMLKELGVGYVIVGHSERRAIFGEDDRFINAKVLACLENGARPILCVGEVLAEREAGRTEKVVEAQLERCLENVPAERLEEVVVAYEPVWAIGTGKTATPEQAQEVHAFIRERLAGISGRECAAAVRIQYGGSVKPENAAALMSCPDIDGALVGGASLSADSFLAIVRA